MTPGRQMRPQSFRQWIRGIDQGTVQLACERGPGQAGRSAVAAFVADFPKVRVEVAYEAAAAQADAHGCTDATQGPGGTWLKAFAARRCPGGRPRRRRSRRPAAGPGRRPAG
ncbi:hypothetical protein AB0N09_37225 [Streptomyces erythrochromogenes]|uniref:hypothetical protein n=1 Tax=Streptomyces erythrochromogenes TaxID=285574 RepID=UPI00342A6E66